MVFHGAHVIEYAYSRPVFLEPQVIRLRPRCDGVQQLRRFQITVDPPPAGMTECLDIEGNTTIQAWFSGNTEGFRVASTFAVETLRVNVFDFIFTDRGAERLPLNYSAQEIPLLSPYLTTSPADRTVIDFAEALVRECGGKTLPFLDALNRGIYEAFECVVRETGDPAPARVTLRTKRGSCRDLAVVFIAACRSQGIAARFVSGYQEGDPDQQTRYLHAWAEVYLPGAGWRGYDPTHGLAVASGHIALAASYEPARAAPVSGTFRGTGALSNMQARIDLQKI